MATSLNQTDNSPDKVGFLHVMCYKWGTAYPSEEVNILRAMVRRNLSVPHRFYCLTDDPEGLDDDIEVLPIDHMHIPGNDRKLKTFSSDFLGVPGEYVVSLDIDIVITDSIDFLADRPEKDFLIADHYWSGQAIGHGAVYRLKVGSMAHVWERYIADPQGEAMKLRGEPPPIGEQRWLANTVPEMEFFPREKIVSFKRNCDARSFKILGSFGARLGLTTAHFGSARLPKGAAIVSFHGKPLPRDVRDGRYLQWKKARFVAEHWHK